MVIHRSQVQMEVARVERNTDQSIVSSRHSAPSSSSRHETLDSYPPLFHAHGSYRASVVNEKRCPSHPSYPSFLIPQHRLGMPHPSEWLHVTQPHVSDAFDNAGDNCRSVLIAIVSRTPDVFYFPVPLAPSAFGIFSSLFI